MLSYVVNSKQSLKIVSDEISLFNKESLILSTTFAIFSIVVVATYLSKIYLIVLAIFFLLNPDKIGNFSLIYVLISVPGLTIYLNIHFYII